VTVERAALQGKPSTASAFKVPQTKQHGSSSIIYAFSIF